MGFSLSSVKNTLHNAVEKPSLKNIAAAAIMVTPLGLAGTLAVANKDAIKSTLHSVGSEVKKDAKVVGSTIAKEVKHDVKVVGSTVKQGGEIAIKGAKKAGSVVTSGFTNMLYIGGAALVGLVVLKMTVFK